MGVRVKMVISDQISEQLRKLGELAPQMIDRIVFAASLEAKKKVRGGMRRVLTERSGKSMKQVGFRRTGKARYKLKGPRLGSIYEYNGADIFPKNAPILKWRDQLGNWQSSDFVHIDAKPFFYPSMREFVEGGEFDRVLSESLEFEIKREGIKL